MGHGNLFCLGCLVVALVGGATWPQLARVIGVMVVAPGLLLSPWTAPRGDNDGLWVLIVPMLVILMLASYASARLSARVGRFFASR